MGVEKHSYLACQENWMKHGQDVALDNDGWKGDEKFKEWKAQDEYLHEIKKGSSFRANERHFKEGVEKVFVVVGSFSQNEKVSCRYTAVLQRCSCL